jgi:CBS domain-containing protein
MPVGSGDTLSTINYSNLPEVLTMVLVAKDIVEKEFLSLSRDTTALEGARQMKAKRHGYAIIASSTGSPEGIVTEWDYLSKIVAEGRDPSLVRLGDIMSSDLVSVDANVGLDQVAELMAHKGIRRVLVLKDHKVIGVITAAIMLSRLKEYVDKVSSTIARLQSPMM